MTRDEIEHRIAIALVAHAAAPAKWRQAGGTGHEDFWMGDYAVVNHDRVLLECNTNFRDEGKAIAAHIAANHPAAVIELCQELLAAREEIAATKRHQTCDCNCTACGICGDVNR